MGPIDARGGFLSLHHELRRPGRHPSWQQPEADFHHRTLPAVARGECTVGERRSFGRLARLELPILIIPVGRHGTGYRRDIALIPPSPARSRARAVGISRYTRVTVVATKVLIIGLKFVTFIAQVRSPSGVTSFHIEPVEVTGRRRFGGRDDCSRALQRGTAINTERLAPSRTTFLKMISNNWNAIDYAIGMYEI